MYGMDPLVGQLSFDYEENKFGKKPFSKKLANTIDQQARRLVGKAYKETEKLLSMNRDKLDLLATKLLEKEVLNYKDFEQLIGPPPHGRKNTIETLDLNSMIDPKAGGSSSESARENSENRREAPSEDNGLKQENGSEDGKKDE